MNNILCIGKLTYDIFCPMEGIMQPGQKYMNNERIENGGGEVANAAFLLGKWGVKSTIAGVVGSDDFAVKIKKELDGVQIDTSLIETSYESDYTGSKDIILAKIQKQILSKEN